MLFNRTESAYTSRQLNGSKWLLLLCALSAAAVDAVICALLCVGGQVRAYLACPVVLLALDAVYFTVSLFFTNFRFRYSLIVWISYILLFTVGVSVGASIYFGGDGTVVSNGAAILWISVHMLNIVCAAVCALYASRVVKKLFIALPFALALIVACAIYAGYLFKDGFFGQGYGVRPLVYALNDDKDSYAVTDAVYGKSGKIRIPGTFNGKPVTAVSFRVLAAEDIEEVELSQSVAFTDADCLLGNIDFKDKVLRVDREYVNAVRRSLYGQSGGGNITVNAVALANAAVPSALDEGEVYVAFNYSPSALAAFGGATLPVYMGAPDKFDMDAYAAEYPYISHRDRSSKSDLHYAYGHGGYILTDVRGKDGSLLGKPVTGNTVADVTCEKVYRIAIGSGNDTKYNLHDRQPSFCFDEVDGKRIDYRYTTLGDSDSLLGGLTPRKGFTLEWSVPDGGNQVNIDSLRGALEKLEGHDLSLNPVWSLNAPRIVLSTSATGNRLTYGEDVTLKSYASAEADGVTLKYLWRGGKPTQDWETPEVLLTRPTPTQSGSYSLTVTADGGEVTSLTSQSTVSIGVTIQNKRVSFAWNDPRDDVYDGQPKTVGVTFDTSQLVGGDIIDYNIDGSDTAETRVTDAKSYTFTVNASGECAAYYDFSSTMHRFTVKKREVQVEWSNFDNLVYNGYAQQPTATAYGVPSDGELPLTVSGSKLYAGEGYTAEATTTNGNYSLASNTHAFSIAKKPLTITPSNVTATYGSAPLTSSITLSGDGFVRNEGLSVLGGSANYAFVPALGSDDYKVGYYTDGVTLYGLTSPNYDITFATGSYTVLTRTVKIKWGNTEQTYNSSEQSVTADISNKVGNDDVQCVIYNGRHTNAGPYTASVTSLTGARAENYALPFNQSDKSKYYTIEREKIFINTYDIEAVYGEEEKPLLYNHTGTIYDDEVMYNVTRETGNDVGSYGIYFYMTRQNSNYQISGVRSTYKIVRRTVELEWSGYKNLTYDGTAKSVTAAIANKVDGDDVAIQMAGTLSPTSAGEYIANAYRLTGVKADNYQLPSENTLKYSVAKAKVNVVPDDKSSVYGEELQTLTGTVTGAIYRNDFVIRYAKDEGIYAGQYSISASAVGSGRDNYELTLGTATYTITKRSATVNWGGYEGLKYDGSKKQITYAVTGLLPEDQRAMKVEGDWAVTVGKHTASVSLPEAVAGSYELANGTLDWYIERGDARLNVALRDGGSLETGGTYDKDVVVGDLLSWNCNAACTVTVNGTAVNGDTANSGSYRFFNEGGYTVIITVRDFNYNETVTTYNFNVHIAEAGVSPGIPERPELPSETETEGGMPGV